MNFAYDYVVCKLVSIEKRGKGCYIYNIQFPAHKR